MVRRPTVPRQSPAPGPSCRHATSLRYGGFTVIGLDGISSQALSDTIGAIHDCALDPQQWLDTCRRIAELCESTAGGIWVHDTRHVQNDQLLVFGYQPEFLEKFEKHYAQSPMAAAAVVSNVG